MRVGTGWDLHRLGSGRTLILGGVVIPSEKGEIAHSDGDVLVHAIIDALLGALAKGDIGSHFPDSDPRYKDISSIRLLKQVLEQDLPPYSDREPRIRHHCTETQAQGTYRCHQGQPCTSTAA